MPGPIAEFIESLAVSLGCRPDLPGVLALTALGICIGKKRSIAIKSSYVEYPTLWTAIAAEPGGRKSPVLAAITRPLNRLQERLWAEYAQAMDEWREAKEGPKPRLQQIITSSGTTEGIRDMLAGNRITGGYFSDELLALIGGFGQYKGGRGDDRQNALQWWSGGLQTFNRAGDQPPVTIRDARLPIGGCIQNSVCHELVQTDRPDGFGARFLIAMPEPMGPQGWNDSVPANSVAYDSVCEQLFDLPPLDTPYGFSREAKARWVGWYDGNELEAPGPLLAPMWAKAPANCLRLTLVVHMLRELFNENRTGAIDLKDIDGGIALIEYFKSHAIRVYGRASLATANGKVTRVIKWLRESNGSRTARQARQNDYFKDTESAVDFFKHLEEEGYGTLTKEPRNSFRFTLNPDV